MISEISIANCAMSNVPCFIESMRCKAVSIKNIYPYDKNEMLSFRLKMRAIFMTTENIGDELQIISLIKTQEELS
jgi:hypothetical protein